MQLKPLTQFNFSFHQVPIHGWVDSDVAEISIQISWTPWVGLEQSTPELGSECLNHYATKPELTTDLNV